ncbi:kunitz-type serine protease inhibitor A [Trichonephila clavata]|uniref:Kunitz-type serine protease inhibitor A n=1 Tax=Trichonephila clavata TaxID=2740835 RepID=A0A8X6F5M6_TRICU|nr:kunitz-type serine protease inhibitor A [Trichonephila clavata]
MKAVILFLAVMLLCSPLVAADKEKTCDEKPKSGKCRAYFPSYYYDKESGSCKEFIYGGCGGNGNRYDTEKECLDNCKGS